MGKTDIAKQRLKDAVKNNETKLDLSGLALTTEDLDLVKFFKKIRKTNLVTIDLSNNDITVLTPVKQLPKTLNNLNINNNPLCRETSAQLYSLELCRRMTQHDTYLTITSENHEILPQEWVHVFGKEKNEIETLLDDLKYMSDRGYPMKAITTLEIFIENTREFQRSKAFTDQIRQLFAMPLFSPETPQYRKLEILKSLSTVKLVRHKPQKSTSTSESDQYSTTTGSSDSQSSTFDDDVFSLASVATDYSRTSALDSENHAGQIVEYTNRFRIDIAGILERKGYDLQLYKDEGHFDKAIANFKLALQEPPFDRLESTYLRYLSKVEIMISNKQRENEAINNYLEKFKAYFSKKHPGLDTEDFPFQLRMDTLKMILVDNPGNMDQNYRFYINVVKKQLATDSAGLGCPASLRHNTDNGEYLQPDDCPMKRNNNSTYSDDQLNYAALVFEKPEAYYDLSESKRKMDPSADPYSTDFEAALETLGKLDWEEETIFANHNQNKNNPGTSQQQQPSSIQIVRPQKNKSVSLPELSELTNPGICSIRRRLNSANTQKETDHKQETRIAIRH